MQACRERYRDTDDRDRRDVVEEDAGVLADGLDELHEMPVEALFAHRLVIEGRQRHDAGTAHVQAGAGQPRGVRDVRQPRSRNHQRRVDARVDERLDGVDAFVDADRERLAGGAERHQPGAALVEQPPGVRDVEIARDRHVVVERRKERHQYAADRCRSHVLGSGSSGAFRERQLYRDCGAQGMARESA